MPLLRIDTELAIAKFQDGLNAIQSSTQRTAKRMESAFQGVKGVVASLGVGVSIAGITALVKGAIDAADKLGDLQKSTGVAANELLVLQGAAIRSGASMDDVQAVASKLSVRLKDAKTGTGDAADAFKALQISVTDSSGKLKNVDTILGEVGSKLKTFEDGADKAALATAALGKGGDTLIPFIEAIDETRQRFQALGITISQDTLNAADKFNDTLSDLNSVTGVLRLQLAEALLPILQRIADAFIDVARNSDGIKDAVSAAIGPLKVMAAGFVTIHGVASAAAERIAGVGFAIAQLSKGNFKQAFEELRLGVEKSTARMDKLGDSVSNIFSNVQSGTTGTAAARPPARPPAPQIRDSSKDKSASDKAAREAAEAERKALAEAKSFADAQIRLIESRGRIIVEAEKTAADGRLAILERMHSEGLVGEREFFEQRAQIRKQAFDAELAEINTLVGARLKAFEQPAKDSTRADRLNAQRELEEIVAKRDKLIADSSQAEKIAALERTRAEREYRDEVANVSIAIDELRGKTVEASLARFDLSNRSLRQRAESNRDTDLINQLDLQRKLTQAQLQFSEAQDKSNDILARLSIEEERIQNSRRVGAISEFESLKQLDAARRATLEPLREQAQLQERIANLSGNDKLKIQAEQAKVQLEGLAVTADLVGDKIRGVFEDAFSSEFENIINGTKSVKDAFLGMVNSIASQIAKLGTQELASKLFAGLGGGGAAAGAGGGGTNIADFIKNIFGFGGTTAVGKAAPGAPAAGDQALTTLAASAKLADASLATLGGSAAGADVAISALKSSAEVVGQALAESIPEGAAALAAGGVDTAAVAGQAEAQVSAATLTTAFQTLALEIQVIDTSFATMAASTQLTDTALVTFGGSTTQANVQLVALSSAAQLAATALSSLAATAGASDVFSAGASAIGGGLGGSEFGAFASIFGLKAGGVMTGKGPRDLQRYAFGGIANQPQIALFGEGSQAEAFVPLPDGRRIPVEMRSAGNQTVIQHFHFVDATSKQTQLQVGARAQQGLDRAGRNL